MVGWMICMAWVAWIECRPSLAC